MKTGVYKPGRPASFLFAPADGVSDPYEAPSAWCACFDGSTYEHFLEEFRISCGVLLRSMAEYFRHGGRAVQVYDFLRLLEIPRRICSAISDCALECDVGCWLFQLAVTQTRWFLLDAGMNGATDHEGNPAFVARSPDGNAISKEWTARMW